ncbi:hypothetical protein DFH07DRAFT_766321 [Mycena maculata]|uniref:DUF4140 domain-containing protein n=1 Tax=Mycena maculata TaxID=230809 RepID=A0AAD7K3P7_9AGAR|nr:hypothetical protein DFH07DRAFT_766321 [Mycena maculata]
MAASLKLSAQENLIKAVTVYKSCNAEVVHVFSVDLKSGSNKIKITELPSCMDTQSVRVSGLGNARLFDIACTTRDKPSKSSEAVWLLTAKKTSVLSEKQVRNHESALLVTYGKTLSAEHHQPFNNLLAGAFTSLYKPKSPQAMARMEKNESVDRSCDFEYRLPKPMPPLHRVSLEHDWGRPAYGTHNQPTLPKRGCLHFRERARNEFTDIGVWTRDPTNHHTQRNALRQIGKLGTAV